MSEASVIFDSAWRQLDTRARGYIPPSDLPLLIDAIEANLTLPLLDATQLQAVKHYARTSVQRVHKTDFRSLFSTLVGMDYVAAVKRAGWDTKAIDALRKELPSSSPLRPGMLDNKENEPIHPSFKKEYKQYKRLSESQEREIEYRDEVIHKLEKKEAELEKYILKNKEAVKLTKDLEDDVLYRDRVIMEKDSKIKEKEREILRLRDEVKRWRDDSMMWQSQNEDQWKEYAAQKEAKFNAELLQRVQQQSKQIELLKRALYQKSTVIKQVPITPPPPSATKKAKANKENTLYVTQNMVYFAIFCLVVAVLLYRPGFSEPTSGSWYEGTWFEPIIYEWVEDDTIDYDYYNLGDINEDYLMSAR